MPGREGGKGGRWKSKLHNRGKGAGPLTGFERLHSYNVEVIRGCAALSRYKGSYAAVTRCNVFRGRLLRMG